MNKISSRLNSCDCDRKSPENQMGKVILVPDDRKVIIRNVECQGEELYTYLDTTAARNDPIAAVVRVLECGANVLNRASSHTDVEHMEKLAGESFNRLEKVITDYIQRNLDPSEQGTLARRIADQFRTQQDQIRETIHRGDMHVNEFQKQMAVFAESLQGTLQSALTTAMSSDQTAIAVLLREVKGEVQVLRDAIVTRATENLTSPSVKGENFEDLIFGIINNWAGSVQNTVANVIVEDVRTVTGPRGKTGDAVIRLITAGESRVCVEMKSQEQISASKIIEVCKAAKENRNADLVIYVASDAAFLPAEFGNWMQYDDAIVTSTPGFEIAMRIAAARLLLQKAKTKNEEIDVERGLALLQNIDSELKKFNMLLTCCRATAKNAEKTQQTAIDIRNGIEEAAEELLNLLNGTAGK